MRKLAIKGFITAMLKVSLQGSTWKGKGGGDAPLRWTPLPPVLIPLAFSPTHSSDVPENKVKDVTFRGSPVHLNS